MTEGSFVRRLRRPQVRGKYLFVGNQKLLVRGTTYGTFRPDAHGNEYGTRDQVERDLVAIAANGFNALRTYTVPPRWLLDTAERHGLRVMVGLPWEQHVAFLDEPARCDAIEQRVRTAVSSCAGHPAVLMYAVGNEIPAPIVRWHGRRRVERFLERLCRAVRSEDPAALVTYVNYPTTEYLELPFLDLACFNVYLESQERLTAYLARLQNLVGDRPLIMSEIGLDSRRHGLARQARSLYWQVRTTFAAGAAGAFVFAWTDKWHRGGHDIDDWDFGLTRRDRRPKPALAAARQAMAEAPFARDGRLPRISVVVCTYNGARTIRDTCEGLRRLDYPNFEVIVVNDGSTDRTVDIVEEYGFRVISGENRGLSHARNVGTPRRDGRDRRLHRRRRLSRPGLAAVSRRRLRRVPPRRHRGPEHPAAGRRPGGRGRRQRARRTDSRPPLRPGSRAHPRLQHGVPPVGAAGDRGIRPPVPNRRRRRGHLLAAARAGVDARLPSGRRRVASPPQLGAHVLEAAEGVRTRRGAARAQVAREVQRRRTRQLGGKPLRAGAAPGRS